MLLWTTGFFVLAALSLTGKVVEYGAPPEQTNLRDVYRVAEFLAAHGWTPAQGMAHAENGDLGIQSFSAPECPALVDVVILAPSGDTAFLLRQLAMPDDKVFYAYRGRTLTRLPLLGYIDARFGALMEKLGLAGRQFSSIIGVREARECHLEHEVPWRELWAPASGERG